MRKHLCVGALVVSILASVAVLPVAVVRLAKDIKTLVTFDISAVTTHPR